MCWIAAHGHELADERAEHRAGEDGAELGAAEAIGGAILGV